jgi:hypothetical protein
MKIISEGTKSYLIGAHSFIFHPLFILKAWYKLYKSWPTWYELIGIFLHDVGICGRNYLSDDNAKNGHWKYGAYLAARIVYDISGKSTLAWRTNHFVAGHAPKESGHCKSKLYLPDKYKWVIAPLWWMWCNYYIEGFKGYSPKRWKLLVAENLKKENPLGNHELYIKHRDES